MAKREAAVRDEPPGLDEWVECWNCGGEGEIEDEDWQFAGDFYTCDICEGHGGWERRPGPCRSAMDDDPGM